VGSGFAGRHTKTGAIETGWAVRPGEHRSSR
jgi:hypothetical protein